MKWEDNIKHQLEERRIEPRASTWEQLETHLDEEEKTPFLMYWRIGIVAAVLIGVIISGLVINQHNVSSLSGILAAKDNTTKILKKVKKNPSNNILEQQEVNKLIESETLTDESENIFENPETSYRNMLVNAKINNAISEKQYSINHSKEQIEKDLKNQQENTSNLANVATSKTFEEPILNKGWNKKNNSEPKDEADELLQKAQRKIKVEVAFKSDLNYVVANDLLQEVNYENNKKSKRFPELIQEGWNYATTLYNRQIKSKQ